MTDVVRPTAYLQYDSSTMSATNLSGHFLGHSLVTQHRSTVFFLLLHVTYFCE